MSDSPQGPPCLQTILQKGSVVGAERLEVALNLAIYFRKVNGADATIIFHELESLIAVNPDLFDPFVPGFRLREIAETIALWRHENYRCNLRPMSLHCDRELCLTRQFGVGEGPTAGGEPLRFGALVKYETAKKPTWIWRINDTDVRLTTTEIQQQKRFLAKMEEALGVMVTGTSSITWMQIYSRAVMDAVTVIDTG